MNEKLIELCASNNLQSVFGDIKSLVLNGADMNYKDKYRFKPMYYLCTNKYVKLEHIKFFQEIYGLKLQDSNAYDDDFQFTLLMCTCMNNVVNLDIMKYAIEIGVDINQKTNYIIERTAFEYLCENTDVTMEKIKFMVENGAKIHTDINIILGDSTYVINKVDSLVSLFKNIKSTMEQIKYLVDNIESGIINDHFMCNFFDNSIKTFQERLEIIKYVVDKKNGFDDENVAIFSVCACEYFQLEEKIEIIRYMKKYIKDIECVIDYIHNESCDELFFITNELNSIESSTKSAAKII